MPSHASSRFSIPFLCGCNFRFHIFTCCCDTLIFLYTLYISKDTFYMTWSLRYAAHPYNVNILGKYFYNCHPMITQITQSGTFGSHLPTLQIVADFHPYTTESQSLSLFRFYCVHPPSTQSADPVVEDLLFGSSQLSGFQNTSLIKAGSRTFNQSIISLTIHSASQGCSIKSLSWKRHLIANKIYLLDVDAWVNAKLQWRRSRVSVSKSYNMFSDSELSSSKLGISNGSTSEFPSQWVEPSLQCCSISSTRTQRWA
jgi:hypothetical protein